VEESNFLMFMVSPHAQERSIIRDFARTSFMDFEAPCFFYFLLLNLLLVRYHQAEIIIIKRLIQGCNKCATRVEVEPRSRDRAIFQGEGEQRKKSRKSAKKVPKNSTFEPLSTIFVTCLKIQGGSLPPAADAHANIPKKNV